MPIRYIDSEIWNDEWFCELGFFEQMLWIGLFSKCGDSQGRFRDNAALIRSTVFPTKDVLLEHIGESLDRFATAGVVHRYEVAGKRYVQLVRWWDYQCPRFAMPSEYPPPEGWQDHVKATLRGKVVQENWQGPAEHARLARQWVRDQLVPRGGTPVAPAAAVSCGDAQQTPAAAGNNPDPDPGLRTPDPDTENTHGAASAAPCGPSPPLEQVICALQDEFCRLTGLSPPAARTPGQQRAAGALWGGPLQAIAEVVEGDVDAGAALIRAAVARLREKDCIVKAPKSVLGTAQAMAGEVARQRDPRRRIEGYEHIVRH